MRVWSLTYADMRLLDAAILLNGLDPAVSRAKQFSKERLAIIGHRVSHLFTEERYKMVRKFLHPSDPTKNKPKGTPGLTRRRARLLYCRPEEPAAANETEALNSADAQKTASASRPLFSLKGPRIAAKY